MHMRYSTQNDPPMKLITISVSSGHERLDSFVSNEQQPEQQDNVGDRHEDFSQGTSQFP